jgi:hypothetical protein
MQIEIKHSRNSVAGWDVDVTVSAESEETISMVTVYINDFPEVEETPRPDARKTWHKVLARKGEYPGSNIVVVSALDQDSKSVSAEDKW